MLFGGSTGWNVRNTQQELEMHKIKIHEEHNIPHNDKHTDDIVCIGGS
jgi:hypothetical protein